MPALATDLYQLTMMAGYFQAKRLEDRATFELFVRRMPPNRAFLLCAGLQQALQYLETLRFTDDEIRWLRRLPQLASVPAPFFDYLRSFRFTGDAWAMPEGTPFFASEPVLRVSAPIAEAQLVETALLAIVNFQISIASKAQRMVQAAGGRPVIEFGARRAHGAEAALYAARAAYLAGCEGTSFVEAGRQFDIPLSGTMAHSWILAARSERDAFVDYADLFGGQTVLLLDTFDVASAIQLVVASGLRPSAVRLDSGDLAAQSRAVRGTLDAAGLSSTKIIASGDLDEWKIAALVAAGAPIDIYAVGTALVTSDDAPALGGIYKLVEVDDRDGARPVMKRSEGKPTWPGRKQVWRVIDGDVAERDVVSLADESGPPGAVSLLQPVMQNGVRLLPPPRLDDIRRDRAGRVASLPQALHRLEGNPVFPVDRSPALARLMDGMIGN